MSLRPTLPSGSSVARVRAAAAGLAFASLAVACGGHHADAADTTAGGAAPAQAGAASGSEGTIHLQVVGGPNAGTYDVTMHDGGCSYGLAGKGAWGNQYSVNTDDPKKFSSLQLIVPDAKAAASGTSTFQMTAGFGPLFGKGQTNYDVNTRPDALKKTGSGKVTVEDHGSTGRVSFEAKTADGVELHGTIDCADVMRAG